MSLRRATLIALACALLASYLHLQKLQRLDAAKLARHAAQTRIAPPEMRRTGDCTYLTIAEWNLVFGPEEYAQAMVLGQPSRFPYLGQTRQFWEAYATMYRRVEPEYPFNTEYHVMDSVIGVSATAEYTMKCLYERTLGRVAESTRRHGLTAEDRLAAKVAQDYVDFVMVEPWYLFDFATPLRQVWLDTGWLGDDLLRKWERKYFLTSEYAIKFVYAWLIGQGSTSAYGVQEQTTATVIDAFPSEVGEALPAIKLLRRFDDGSALVTLPRYQAFLPHALGLAHHGTHFREIAGNSDLIMVGVVGGSNLAPPRGNILLTQDLLTQPGQRRTMLELPISQLSQSLLELESSGLRIEHIYDF
jgi:hypothetical protein